MARAGGRELGQRVTEPPGPSATSSGVRGLLQELGGDAVGRVKLLPRALAFVDAGAVFEAAGEAVTAMEGLRTYFVDAIARGHLVVDPPRRKDGVKDPEEPRFVVYLRKQYQDFKARCLEVLQRSLEVEMQVAALTAVMEVARREVDKEFRSDLFCQALLHVLKSPGTSSDVVGVLVARYLRHADVRYYTLRTIRHLSESLADAPPSRAGLQAPTSDDAVRTAFDVLRRVEALPADAALTSWCGAIESGAVEGAADRDESARKRRKRQREEGAAEGLRRAQWATPINQVKEFAAAWLAFLRVPLPGDIYRKVLLCVHSTVLPNMPNPLLLSDFLTASLSRGGIIGMLALHGIFTLVTKHGLEYPQFFQRLYSLLKPAVFLIKNRAQFFQLADVFLSSPMVPAYTAAAFAKRFGRLALSAPPHGAMVCIAFINNVVRRHPACNVLLHRVPAGKTVGDLVTHPKLHEGSVLWEPLPDSAGDEGAGCAGTDPYAEDEEDPAKSRAVESSLWELAALVRHACPQVAHFAHQVLQKDLTDRAKTAEADLEPLLRLTYAKMFEVEHGRKLKPEVPVAFYDAPPQGLHDPSCHADFAAFQW